MSDQEDFDMHLGEHPCFTSDLIRPGQTVLTPSSCRSSSSIEYGIKSPNRFTGGSDALSMLNDKEFCRVNGISDPKEIAGREKIFIDLRKTYKNIDKAE